MSIDTERLKDDPAYWDEVDPTNGHATHFDTEDHQDMPWMMFKNGDWFAYQPPERLEKTGHFIGPLETDDEWIEQEGWEHCIAQPLGAV